MSISVIREAILLLPHLMRYSFFLVYILVCYFLNFIVLSSDLNETTSIRSPLAWRGARSSSSTTPPLLQALVDE